MKPRAENAAGKTILLTGATDGIGRVIAERSSAVEGLHSSCWSPKILLIATEPPDHVATPGENITPTAEHTRKWSAMGSSFQYKHCPCPPRCISG